MPDMKKVLVKVIRDNDIKWSHFCYISSDLYEEFLSVTGCERADIGAFLSVWARGDFNEDLAMSYYEDVVRLRYLVNKKFADEYSELYALTEEENPRIKGWIRMWVSQHMRVEIAARKRDYDGQ